MKINFNNSLIILELDKKYNVNNITKLSYNELKKQYHILALNYHPDKNNENDSKEHFQNINSAYKFLKNIIKNNYENIQNERNIDSDEEDINEFENTKYYELIINFINIMIAKNEDINIDQVNDFKNDCKDYIYNIIEKILNKLNLHVLQEIYKILINLNNNANNNNSNININERLKNIIIEIINNRLKDFNYYIINPKLNNIINSEVYILEIDNNSVYIPLWHNELNYENNIIHIDPILNTNIEIDDHNNIHYKHYDSFENFINLIKENKDDFPHIEIIIDKYNLAIPINELNFKKYQTYIFKEIGIPKINTKNIFENNNKANIIIHIHLQ